MRCRWISIARSLSPSLRASAVSTMSRSCRSRMPSLSRIARPKLSEMRSAWGESGQARRTISRVVPRRSGMTRAEARGERAVLVMMRSFLGFALGSDRALWPSLPRVRSTRTGVSGPLQGAAAAKASMGGLRTSGPSGLRRTRPPMTRRRSPIACDLPLKRTAAGSDRSTNRGSDGQGASPPPKP